MKIFKIKYFYHILLFVFLFSSIYAQDDKPKEKLYLMHMDVVNIDKSAQYEENVKKELELWKKHGMETTIQYVSKSDDNVYRFFTPLEDYGDIGKQNEYWENFNKNAGEETVKNLYKGYAGTYSSHKNTVVKHLIDLSFMPENSRIKPEEIKFLHMDHYYFKENKIEEGMEMMKEFKELMIKKNSNDPYNVWSSDIGGDIGWIAVVRYGTSSVDYYQETNRRMETFAEEFKEMWPKFSSTLKRFDHQNSTPLPDFRYFPEK